MNLWKKIETLGITEDMPIYKQKSTIFFNAAMRIYIISLIISGSIMVFTKGLMYIPLGFVIGIALIIFSLYLNYKSKVNLSAIFIAVLFPIYLISTSIFSKLHGEGTESIFYILPRFGIIIVTIISFVVLGFNNLRGAFIGTIVGFLSLFFFDKIHMFFGLKNNLEDFKSSDFGIIITIFGILLVFVLIILFFLQKINFQYENIVNAQKASIQLKNEELYEQNEEIKSQRDTVIEQKNEIEKSHKKISDSIVYAQRIQQALLPDNKLINKTFPNNFILNKPRDIVSGDFYYFNKKKGKVFTAVADCTGHGVPGAFVSMLGISFLNEITNNNTIKTASHVLNELRNHVKTSLKQTGEEDLSQDGMDIAFCIIDIETNKLEFSGANNPLYIIRTINNQKEIIVIDADKQPIGIYLKEKPFKNSEVDLFKNDRIFMFSDGYIDQFGGGKNRKFMSKRFKQLLKETSHLSMNEQKDILNTTIDNWKINTTQNDDIMIFGIEYSNIR